VSPLTFIFSYLLTDWRFSGTLFAGRGAQFFNARQIFNRNGGLHVATLRRY